MNLAQLIESRQRATGDSLRAMARRAAERGTPISSTSLSAYATEQRTALPDEDSRLALANALDVSPEVVTAAAIETAAPQLNTDDGRTVQRAEAWLRLTEGRTDAEVDHLLAVVAATLRAIEASRNVD